MRRVIYHWGGQPALIGEVLGDAYENDGITYLPLRIEKVLLEVPGGAWPYEDGYPVSCITEATVGVDEDDPARAGISSR